MTGGSILQTSRKEKKKKEKKVLEGFSSPDMSDKVLGDRTNFSFSRLSTMRPCKLLSFLRSLRIFKKFSMLFFGFSYYGISLYVQEAGTEVFTSRIRLFFFYRRVIADPGYSIFTLF